MPSEYWGVQGQPANKKKVTITKAELEAKSMEQLRAFCKDHKLKARDNDKVELIEEILREVS